MTVSKRIDRDARTARDLEDALTVAARHPGVFEELAPDADRPARELDKRRCTGALAGYLVSVKANIDVRGMVTTAGSTALAHRPRATRDAAIVRRVRACGAVILGHTAMTELAESAVGRVPRLPNPVSPGVVAGGSSTGDAIAVALGIVRLAVATDEGGSSRIPAAFCGVVGFRPGKGVLPYHGILPLSPTLDGPGLLAKDVHTLAHAFTTLARRPSTQRDHSPRLVVPRDYVWDECEPIVRNTVRLAIDHIADHFHVDEIDLPELHNLAALRHGSDFAAAETAAWSGAVDIDRTRLGQLARARLERGDAVLARDYLRALATRQALVAKVDARACGWDVLLMPTTPRRPPPFAGLTADREAKLNPALLRITRLANLLDRPSVSLPAGAATGLTLLGTRGSDTALLGLAGQVERLLGVPPAATN